MGYRLYRNEDKYIDISHVTYNLSQNILRPLYEINQVRTLTENLVADFVKSAINPAHSGLTHLPVFLL